MNAASGASVANAFNANLQAKIAVQQLTRHSEHQAAMRAGEAAVQLQPVRRHFMPQTISYAFNGAPGQKPFVVDVSTPSTTTTVSGAGVGYAVAAVQGNFEGQQITGLYGDGGQVQENKAPSGKVNGTYDNTVFASSSQGVAGSTDGIDSDGIEFTLADGSLIRLSSSDGVFVGQNVQTGAIYNLTLTGTTYNKVVCFAAGTLIRTARGDVSVEALAAGDLAVTASGDLRRITWIGHRRIKQPGFEQQPVRILAGAFGAGLPKRELRLSPGHPVLVGADEDGEGGHLVPVMCLINGTTVARVAVDIVTYWHVELDHHDILLAEGLPAESYLDWGDRAFFSEADEYALANPDFVVPGLAGRCRPVALDGPVVDAERRRLDALFATSLAVQCAWPDGELSAFAL